MLRLAATGERDPVRLRVAALTQVVTPCSASKLSVKSTGDAAPEAQPWFWTITAREQPPSVYNHDGYAASREQAMPTLAANTCWS